MKVDLDWWKERWVWIAMVLLIVVLGYFLFSTYAEKLPYVSNNHSAWASFGALLAGFFTLTSTLATVATLLFLARQNKGMQQVTQAQLATMTFDRYISHRKLFIELLEEQEKSSSHRYRFSDPTLLYNAVFPQNSLHNCELTASLVFDENGDGTNQLGRIFAKLVRIRETLAKPSSDGREGIDLILDFVDLRHDLLMIEQAEDLKEGDILFGGMKQGFNVFMLDSFVRDAVKLVNVIFSFAKIPTMDVDQFRSCSSALRDSLIKRFYHERPKGGFTVHTDTKFISELVWVWASLSVVSGEDEAFVVARRKINECFSSCSSVSRLKDNSSLRALIDGCLYDVNSKYKDMISGENFTLVAEISRRLQDLKNTV